MNYTLTARDLDIMVETAISQIDKINNNENNNK